MPALMEYPTEAISAPARIKTEIIRVMHHADNEVDNPAHNFAMMGFAWLVTMVIVVGSFVLLQFLFR